MASDLRALIVEARTRAHEKRRTLASGPVRDALVADEVLFDCLADALESALAEIEACNEREAAMEAEASASIRDSHRLNWIEENRKAVMWWTPRNRPPGWTVEDMPGLVRSDCAPTVRAAIDAARGAHDAGSTD